MVSIKACPAPEGTFLSNYKGSSEPDAEATYADCYQTEVIGVQTLANFVAAFYTTPLFKLERLILKLLVNKPSSDAAAHQLAKGEIDKFAAWSLEARTKNELIMCDYQGRTRSWFMVTPVTSGSVTKTHLYFGSAIVPVKNRKTGKMEMGLGFKLLLGFHKLYSRALLWSARVRLERLLS